MSGKLAEREMF